MHLAVINAIRGLADQHLIDGTDDYINFLRRELKEQRYGDKIEEREILTSRYYRKFNKPPDHPYMYTCIIADFAQVDLIQDYILMAAVDAYEAIRLKDMMNVDLNTYMSFTGQTYMETNEVMYGLLSLCANEAIVFYGTNIYLIEESAWIEAVKEYVE